VSVAQRTKYRRSVSGEQVTNELIPPIIVFGNTRSGTTIVQDLIAQHPGVVAWYEPRNLWQFADPGRDHDELDAADASEKVKRYIRKKFTSFQRRSGGRRIVEKTPVNILRIPYVREIFPDATYLYIVRSPWSFISSVELKWQRTVTVRGLFWRFRSTPPTQLHHYVAKYGRQLWDKHVLRRKYLSVWGPRYRGLSRDLDNEPMMTVVARQWSIPSARAAEALEEFAPGTVLCLRYEDLVGDPLRFVRRIAEHCELDVSAGMVAYAEEMIRSDRQEKWRRLDPDDLATLIPEISAEMNRHGYSIPEEILPNAGVAESDARSA
jgi:hypothetical protein